MTPALLDKNPEGSLGNAVSVVVAVSRRVGVCEGRFVAVGVGEGVAAVGVGVCRVRSGVPDGVGGGVPVAVKINNF